MISVGIDVAFRKTGLAVLGAPAGKKPQLLYRGVIEVKGKESAIGPRYVALARSLREYFQTTKVRRPDIVVIEYAGDVVRSVKGGKRAASSVMRLHGAFAVCYVECRRIWPAARIEEVEPKEWKGNLEKNLTSQMMISKYDLPEDFQEDEYDAVGLADYGLDLIRLGAKRDTRIERRI